MLDDNQGVSGHFKNGHGLKGCKGTVELQILEPAVQLAQEGGAFPTDVKDLGQLNAQIAVKDWMDISLGTKGVEGYGGEARRRGGASPKSAPPCCRF